MSNNASRVKKVYPIYSRFYIHCPIYVHVYTVIQSFVDVP